MVSTIAACCFLAYLACRAMNPVIYPLGRFILMFLLIIMIVQILKR